MSTPLLSPAEAADYLRTSEYRVRRLAQSGELARIKDGNRVWFLTGDLDEYLRHKRVVSANPFRTTRPKRSRAAR